MQVSSSNYSDAVKIVGSASSLDRNPFLSVILDRVETDPDHLFGIYHDGTHWTEVTLSQVLDVALRFTQLLLSRKIPHGSSVMLVLRHGMEGPACFLGTMLAGMVPSFLPCPSEKQDHSLYWAQHKHVLAYNRPPLVLVCDDLLSDMIICAEISGSEVVGLSSVATYAPAELTAFPHGDAIGLLQHSSGTTGMKKGVALSYDSISRQLASYRASLAMDPASARIVSWLPLYHDMGLITGFLLPVWLGAPILSIDPFVWVSRPELFFEAIERHEGTHAWLPNFAFLHLAKRVRGTRTWNLSSLLTLISCSEPCKAASFDVFLDRFGAWGIRPDTLQTCYAMAETVFAVSQSDIASPVRRLSVDADCLKSWGRVVPPKEANKTVSLLSNGQPITGCEVGVLRDGGLVDDEEIGEICISADFMFSGYHNNPDATAAASFGKWYRTGDIGFIQQGEIFIVGRTKEIIIVNGKNIFVHDIEAALLRVSGIKPGRSVAFGRFSDKAGSELLIVVAERASGASDDRELLREINNSVVDEVGITCSDIRLVDPGWLVKTTSGKISRSENASRYEKDFLSVV